LDYFQPPEAPTWDPLFCSDSLTLSDNNRAIYREANALGGGVQSAQPCSRFSVKIVKGHTVLIGFAPRHGFQKNKRNFVTCGWFLSVEDGRLWSQIVTWNKPYGTAIPEGSTVTAIHDTRLHTIEFQVDGISLGIAFNNITHENLYAAADYKVFSYCDVDLRIMDNY
jgi:hypothetical protein